LRIAFDWSRKYGATIKNFGEWTKIVFKIVFGFFHHGSCDGCASAIKSCCVYVPTAQGSFSPHFYGRRGGCGEEEETEVYATAANSLEFMGVPTQKSTYLPSSYENDT
jgi:hypothetical protein